MSILPLWARVLIVGLVLAGLYLLVSAGIAHHDAGVAQAATNAERSIWQAAEKKRLDEEAAERVRLDKQREESDRETRRNIELAQDHRAAADAAAAGLRRDVDAAVVAAKRADSAPIGQRPAADTTLDLLAGLLQRADDEAGILADYADRARIAGQQCERDYDALKGAAK